jgi:formylglycine-generating enzyme required for sulfatase activity/F0F1-type ATP synthase epsilon subunit
MSHEVFISYADEDKSVADAICKALEDGGVRCWYAPRDVPYEVDYEDAIIEAISESKLMVLILSSHANESRDVKREVKSAYRDEPQVPVLPFQIENVILNPSFKYYIGSVHWLRAHTPPLEEHLHRLVDYVQRRLSQHKHKDVSGGTQEKQPNDAERTEEYVEPLHSLEEGERKEDLEAARKYAATRNAEAERLRYQATLAAQVQKSPYIGETQGALEPQHVTWKAPPPATPSGLSQRTVSEVETKPRGKPARMQVIVAVYVVMFITAVAVWSWVFWQNGSETANESASAYMNRANAPAPKEYEFETVKFDRSGKVTERRKGRALYFAEEVNSVKLEMVLIPEGSFTMGSPDTLKDREYNELPLHEVYMENFYMGKFEVTQAQWRAVASLPKVERDLNPNPSRFNGNNLPVEGVSWDDAVEFCKRLSEHTGRDYRLPSEAEWEYAARARTTTPFAFGETITADVVNYDGNYPYADVPRGVNRGMTVMVGSLGVPNAFGLYDMNGNVAEWCQDAYHINYYDAPFDGSAWAGRGDERITRGGSYALGARRTRSSYRDSLRKQMPSDLTGFRVAMRSRP